MKTNRKIGLTACLAAFLLAGSVGMANLGSTTAFAASNDILTDAEVAALWTKEEYKTMVTEGSTVGNATGDKLTGSFKATSANGVVAGGETVDESAGDFSVIVMGDQQTAVEYHSAYVASSYNWIAANADAMNLKMYVNLGDIVDDVDFLPWVSRGVNATVRDNKGRMGNWKMQLEFASNQVDKLHAAGVPAALVMGNHDYEDMANNYRVKDNFREYFPISDFEEKDYFGDSLYGDVEAAYYYFNGASEDDQYMVVTLGCYPTDAMLAWANEVVEENADKKVIVALHSYVDANSEGSDITQAGARAWDNFISLHENIFLVVNGHECTDDGSIWKRVDYGVHGNPVYQFMINPQKEDFGGAGMFSQFIFRADGTVDVVTYSPYVAQHEGKGYFMDENQFTFTLDLEKLSVAETAEPTEVGNVLSSSEYVSYLGRADEDAWKYSVYDYYNVQPTLSGLQAVEGTGYVTHKLYAGEFHRFNALKAYALGEFGSNTGAYQIDLSTDGERFTTVYYQNAETGLFDFPVELERFVAGAEYVYIRLYVKDSTVSKLSLSGGVTKTVISNEKQFVQEYDFTKYEVGQWNYTQWEKTGGAIDTYFAALAKNNPGGSGYYTVLGSGASGRLSYKSHITYRFDSGDEKRTFESFTADYTMSVTDPKKNQPYEGYVPDDTDTDYLVRALVSTDDGKTWTTVKTDLTANVEFGDSGVAEYWNQVTLDDYVEDQTSFLLRLEYMGYGSGYGSVGFKKIIFGGSFNKSLSLESEEEEILIDYELNGGYFANGEKKDPVREGYAFKGWYDNAAFEGDPIAVKDVEESCTLYAKWERDLFKVTWMLDGGVNASINREYIENGEWFRLGDPTKEGYTFLGWYDEDGNKVTELRGNGKDVVLYARWTEKTAESEKGGCGGSLAILPTLLTLAGVATLLLKKEKSE